MNKKLLLFAFCFATLTAIAQDDVSKYYLANYGFDSDYDYKAGDTDKVSKEILDIPSWTANLSADYTITGVYEFGFKGTFNGASVPSVGYNDLPGGALALSTGWEQTFCYYQTVTLPAGTYTINVPTYNGRTATKGTSMLAWIPNSGTQTTSTLNAYPSHKWTLDQITFTLTKTTTGKIQIGYKAAANGSENSACILLDYVQLLGSDMAVSKTKLKSAITTANRLYGEGTGLDAAELKTAIDAAQAVNDNAEATMPEVLEATYVLNAAIDSYNWKNASESKPLDMTSYINNPSFESNGTAGWEIKGMVTQNNTVFTKKAGTYYLESWVNIGSQ